jgi:hypothetical protein
LFFLGALAPGFPFTAPFPGTFISGDGTIIYIMLKQDRISYPVLEKSLDLQLDKGQIKHFNGLQA